MKDILNSLHKAALGDYSIRIETDTGDGEWNDLCHTVNRLLENMQATIERQKQTEKLLNNIIDQNPYSVWISDEKGIFLRGSRACYRLFNTCEEEVVNKYSILNDEIIKKNGYLPLIRSVFEEGETVQFTLEYDTAELKQIDFQQKTIVYINATISPIQDENGVVTNAIAVHRDITDRVKAEHVLRLTEFCIDRASIGVLRIEPDGRIAAVNQTVCESLGYTRDELLSMTVFDIDGTFSREEWFEKRRQIRERKSGTFESLHVRKDGTTYPIEVTVNYFTFNGKEYSFSFVRDITDRKAVEESLRIFQHSIEYSADAVFWMDRDGHYLYANREACRSLGYTLEELKRLAVWDIDPDSGKKNWHSEKDRYLKEGDRCGGYCIATHRRKDGTTFPVEVLASHFLFGDREIHMAFVRDITERVETERELRVMQSCIDRASIGVHRVHPDGHLSMVNEHFCRNLGYTRDELYRLKVFDIDPFVGPDQLAVIQQYIKEKGSSIFETVHQRKDGTCFPVEITSFCFPYQGEDYLFSFAADITDRKAAEESLRLFQYSIDHAAEAVFWMNREGHFTYANQQACHSLGYTLDELKQLVLWDIDPDYSEALWYSELDRHLQEGEKYTGHFITIHRRKDGSIFPVEVLAKHLFFGEKDVHVAFVRDISERVKAEEALRERERLLQEAQEIANLGHYRLNIATGTWECSETLARIFGIGRDYIKDVDGWINLMYPEDRDAMREYLLQTVIQEKHPFDRIYKIVRFSDGEERWVHGLGRLEFDSDGSPAFMVGTLQDITERKLEEAEKAKLETQLVQAQKMESVGRLAGGVAHDFNNMLCVILGYVELMKDRLPKGDSLLKNLVEIEKAAVHSRDITRQLLAFSRKQIISPIPLDINQHIQDMRKTLSRLIGEDIHLHFHPGENLWQIRFDRAQFDQILMNLAVNARDAMPSGGHLTIETSNVFLDDAYCQGRIECDPGSYVQLVVSDNGIGMDKETLRNIFEPFFTTKEVGKGTGLGLATVYGIVKQNGGSITVYSEPEKGTTFKIFVPRLMDEIEMKGIVEETQPDRGSETILLVEDDEMVRTMTKTMLETMGYSVLVAENPSGAISICERKEIPIDLLFSDVVMPDMSGTELRSRIETIRPGLHVLFMSGYTTNVIVHHGVLEQGVHFVHKPFSMNELSRKIREALGKR